MIFFVISILSGIIGGIFTSHFMSDYTLGTFGNIVTGFLGGAMANVIMLYSLGGSEYSVAVVSGFFAGVIVRAGFSVIRRRVVK